MSIPEQLNHYRIVGPLGKGGMGEVFVAEDTRLHRKVALKVLSGLMAADPERRQRFEREAQAVAAINHPNIVTIHSVEEANGLPFLTMELVDGRPLSEILAGGPLPVDSLLKIGLSISDAVAAAHQRGITHRDLKPANVMVTADGRVKVLDFGLAKLRESHAAGNAEDVTWMPAATDLTGEGRIIGTVAYMSPEQAEGKPVDSRSDIFSLGVILHEAATGEKPFKGDTNVSVISSILKDTPSAITELNPNLPAGLARVIRRALAKDPSRRYQTATDLRNDLEELKQEVDSGVTTSGPGVRVVAGKKVDRKTLAWIAAAMVVLAGLAYGAAKRSGRNTAAESAFVFEADRFTRVTSTGNAFLAAISPDGRYVAHVKSTGPMPSLWLRQTNTTSDVQIVPPAQVRYDGVSFAPDGDYVYYNTYTASGGVAILYRVPVLGGTPQHVLEDVDSRISFSPDRRRFTFTRGSPSRSTAHVMVANADGTDVRELAAMPSPDLFINSGPSWSPDGKTILAAATSVKNGPHNLIVAVDVATGKTEVLKGRWAFVGDVDWAPDGRSFVMAASDFGASGPQIWQVAYPTGDGRRITNDLNNYLVATFSGDGASIATVQAENVSNLWVAPATDLAGGKKITSGRGGREGLNGLTWTPDGRLVYGAATSGRPQIWIANDDGSNARQLTTGEAAHVQPDVTPDGRYIVFQRFTPGGVHIWRMGLDGSDLKQLTTGGAEQNPHAGNGFVYYNTPASGSPRVFKVPIDGGQPVSLSDEYFRVLEISPDHRRLAGTTWDTAGRRPALALLPVEGGALERVPDFPPVTLGMEWMPDGKALTFWAPQGDELLLFKYSLGDRKSQPLAKMPDNLFALAWAPDGKRVAAARGQNITDVVLITAKERSR